MRLEVRRDSIVIFPESAGDEAYIEDTLGLKTDGETIPLRRVAVTGLPMTIAYLKATRQ